MNFRTPHFLPRFIAGLLFFSTPFAFAWGKTTDDECEKILNDYHKQNLYKVNRINRAQFYNDLGEYDSAQRITYKSLIEKLPASAIALDDGAGLALPMIESIKAYEAGEPIKLIRQFAVGIAKPTKDDYSQTIDSGTRLLDYYLSAYPDHFKYLESRLEDLDLKALGLYHSVDVLVSHLGGLSYALDVNLHLNAIFDALKLNGTLGYYDDWHRTRIFTPSNKSLGITEWLKTRTTGLKDLNDEEFISATHRGLFAKIEDQVKIPKLYRIYTESLRPPVKIYSEVDPRTQPKGAVIGFYRPVDSRTKTAASENLIFFANQEHVEIARVRGLVKDRTLYANVTQMRPWEMIQAYWDDPIPMKNTVSWQELYRHFVHQTLKSALTNKENNFRMTLNFKSPVAEQMNIFLNEIKKFPEFEVKVSSPLKTYNPSDWGLYVIKITRASG